MRRGAWHQFGDRSQKLSLEQLEHGAGVGVVISPRDLSYQKALEWSESYKKIEAEILFDPQFLVADSLVGKLSSYETIAKFRQGASKLYEMPDASLKKMIGALSSINEEIGASALIAPAVMFEAGRPDLVELNSRLFAAAKEAGNNLGIPTYATIGLSASITSSKKTLDDSLSDATSVDADGWYYCFEFPESSRVPATHGSVLRFCESGLTLACTGKPVFHAYSGLMSLLAPCFGATAVGIGHSQNLWQVSLDRWQPADQAGGGGNAPPRFFSTSLWGTLIYEDEFALLSDDLRKSILTPSPFSTAVTAAPPYIEWSRWEANKHLVHLLATYADTALQQLDPGVACNTVMAKLVDTIKLHSQIATEGVELADRTNEYQNPWRAALNGLKAASEHEFDLIRLQRGLDLPT